MEFGNVQRGILGVEGGGLNSISSKEYGLSLTQDFTSIKWPEIQALTKLA
jgi:hypothetical protein